MSRHAGGGADTDTDDGATFHSTTLTPAYLKATEKGAPAAKRQRNLYKGGAPAPNNRTV